MAITIENTLGVMFIGVLLSTLLWGVACSQVWTYYRSSSEDSIILKGLVAAVWLADAVFQIIIVYTLYNYTVSHFSQPFFLLTVEKTIPLSVPFLQLTGTLVQGFYAYRIWRLSRRNVIVTAMAILTIAAELTMSVLYTSKALPIRYFPEVNAKMGPYLTGYSAVSVIADWYIAGAMTFFLARSKSHSRADSVVNRLILFTVTTGLLPSVCALVIFFADVFNRDGAIYLAPFFCIGKLYVVSFLAALNMRPSMRAALHASSPLELEPRSAFGLGSTSKRSQFGAGVPTSSSTVQLSVKIDTVSESVVDPTPIPDSGPKRWSRRWNTRSGEPPVQVSLGSWRRSSRSRSGVREEREKEQDVPPIPPEEKDMRMGSDDLEMGRVE